MTDTEITLRLTAQQHQVLCDHLFPGDGFESVALALCGTGSSPGRQMYCIHEIQTIPTSACSARSPVTVRWPVELGIDLFAKADRKGMAVLKIHSHPTDFDAFSGYDDEADRLLLGSLSTWSRNSPDHLSAFMLPNGAMRARSVGKAGQMKRVGRTMVCGDDVVIYSPTSTPSSCDEAQLRTRQAFGKKTTEMLRSLRIGIAGCSGTGSWVAEMLARLGVGHLVIVDPDRVERKNLNRIVNSTGQDASDNALKTAVLARSIKAMDLGTMVDIVADDLSKASAIKALAGCDVIFGCLDSADGRDLLNRIATYYSLPYIDVGVRLDADGAGGVNQVCAAVHYLVPGESSLMSRGVITAAQISTQAMRRHDRPQYESLVKERYLQGVQVESPAVVSINGFAASHAVNELLARIHPFRSDSNREYRYQLFSLRDGNWLKLSDGPPCDVLRLKVGRGDCTPPLDNPFTS